MGNNPIYLQDLVNKTFFRITRERVTIGLEGNIRPCFDDPTISGIHATIQHRPNGTYIENSSGTNPVYWHTKKESEEEPKKDIIPPGHQQQISPGAIITIGREGQGYELLDEKGYNRRIEELKRERKEEYGSSDTKRITLE